MDEYPEHLAPELDKNSRNPITPFEDWWPNVKTEFPNVPEVIAKEWLYRHWGMSPFSWIPSKSYDFRIETFSSNQLGSVLNRCYNYEIDSVKVKNKGMYLCAENPDWKWKMPEPIWLVKFMKENGNFPSPIVILDNRDNHLETTAKTIIYASDIPQGLILLEGHTRHEIGLYLQSVGRMNDSLEICMLRKI